MKVYDFDETIYSGDSSKDFYFYAIKKYPSVLLCLPFQMYAFGLYILGIINKEKFKEKSYCFLKRIKDIDALVNSFWDKNISKIKHFYITQKEESDVIISASPEFLLKPICEKLNVNHLIASNVDKKTGILLGPNCKGSEKIVRFKEIFGNAKIEEFYSDSISDTPMSRLAVQGYMVNGDSIIKWNDYKISKFKKLKKVYLSRDFLAFLFVGTLNTINGITFSLIYSLIIQPNIAFMLGYLSSLTISYLLNSFITFKQTLSFKKYIKFCISYIPNFLIQNFFVLVFYNVLQLPKVLVFILSAIIGVPVTFIILKFFAFSRSKK